MRTRAGNGTATGYPGYGLFFFYSLIFTLTGCASMATRYPYSTADEYGTDIEAYAEHVFRLQNRVSSNLILLMTDSEGNSGYKGLAKAEERILEACESLNRIAIMRAEKSLVSPRTKYKAYDSLERCEHVTREVELMLEADTASE